ncbi:uncharacterized protein G2W53_012165 [Senna tora]|uniref:Uncharacterized protein n=1 Tax=Senna tora TaxID=362788 RepID=A0A834TX87_9FABA|nr:uncharacterized protein G2W53_012165 [Senna tora]
MENYTKDTLFQVRPNSTVKRLLSKIKLNKSMGEQSFINDNDAKTPLAVAFTHTL